MSRYQQKEITVAPFQRLIAYFIALNIFILIAFIFHEYFISRRYTIMALTGLLLLMLPRICSYVENAWLRKNRTILIIVGIILLVNLIDGTTQSNSKSYIKDTALWASQNIPKNNTVIAMKKSALVAPIPVIAPFFQPLALDRVCFIISILTGPRGAASVKPRPASRKIVSSHPNCPDRWEYSISR